MYHILRLSNQARIGSISRKLGVTNIIQSNNEDIIGLLWNAWISARDGNAGGSLELGKDLRCGDPASKDEMRNRYSSRSNPRRVRVL
ncbi:hypothetical protein GB937_009951 [Aspergillus fischeri]|nr:hypothetical protein GB937_009951 [Aspergillus fischeri]